MSNLLVLSMLTAFTFGVSVGAEAVKVKDPKDSRLPSSVAPAMGCWFWTEGEFAPKGYVKYLDDVANHTHFNILTTSIRTKKEVTDPAVRDQIRQACEYAKSRGIKIVMDLDVRLAREAFMKAYPDELQEMLRLRETDVEVDRPTTLKVQSAELGDHYTFNNVGYYATAGKLMKIYAYKRDDKGILPGTLQDITSRCHVEEASPKQVIVTLPTAPDLREKKACLIACFTHYTPDVFAPHLLEFQRDILKGYKGVPTYGACKDEWGFPPCYDGCPNHDDFWYSKWMSEAYSKETNDGGLVRDCLLMYAGEAGRERERAAAINLYQDLCRKRNIGVEEDFYKAVKETFGRSAYVCTHPTWWSYPDSREFRKNGLDWWQVKRNLAQVDETTPYPIRTALSKKWNSPVWYNMYYSKSRDDYRREMWAGCLVGGRVNYHPLWPVDNCPPVGADCYELMRGEMMRGDCRVRLQNLITKSPLDCPVAVVFGHQGAMNWAGPHYNDAGVELANAFWISGYPADLIPTSEVQNGSFVVGKDGFVRYGKQKYLALIFYHPEFEGSKTASFIKRAKGKKTALYVMGSWQTGFDGKPFDGAKALTGVIPLPLENDPAAKQVVSDLKDRVTPSLSLDGDIKDGLIPAKGMARLLDGTYVVSSGLVHDGGDTISGTFELQGQRMSVDALGTVAVRLDLKGQLQAFAAGGLKSLKIGGISVELPERLDLAIWKDSSGKRRGVVQGLYGPMPEPLTRLADKWSFLTLPDPLSAPR